MSSNMKKRRFAIFCLMILSFLFYGCSNSDNITDVTEPNEPTVDQVHVSFKSIEEKELMHPMALVDDLTIFDTSLYVEPFNYYNTTQQKNTLGERVTSATPTKFITGIPDIAVASPRDRIPLTNRNFVHSTDYSGFQIVSLLDLVYAKNLINNKALINSKITRFQVIELSIVADNYMFIPKSSWNGDTSPYIQSTFETYSEIHVELPEEYKDITFDNELDSPIYEPENDNIHVFSFLDLIPLGKKSDTNSLCFFFDKNINEPRIYNPDGKKVTDFNPNLWESERRDSWTGYYIYMPGEVLNFTGGNKEITFIWNLSDMIEVYNNATPDDLTDDLVTLNLSNPFPISFEVNSYSDIRVSSESPDEVGFLEGKYFNEYVQTPQSILRWINPSQESFKQVHIIKKEDSFPENINDGERVYSDSFPVFFDKKVEEGEDYYYKVFVENATGKISKGEEIRVTCN